MSYIGNTPGVSSQRVVLEEVVSGSPKSAFVPQSGYIIGYVDVLVNGVEIDSTDFSAPDGVTVTLATAAAVGDTVKVKTWLPRGLSDGYLKSEADARFLKLIGGQLTGNLLLADGSSANYLEIRNGSNWTGRFAASAVGKAALQYYNGTAWTDGLTLDSSGAVVVPGSLVFSGGGVLSNVAGAGNISLRCTDATTPVSGYIGANAFFNNVWALGSSSNTPLVFVTNGSDRGRFDTGGVFRVNHSNVQGNGWVTSQGDNVKAAFSAKVTSNGYWAFAFHNASDVNVGTIVVGASATSYVTSSDYRLKDITGPMVGALARNKLLQPKVGTWKIDGAPFEGFLAHELKEVFESAAVGEKDAVDADGNPIYQGVGTGPLDAHFSACINELQDTIDELRAELAALKG